MRDPLHSSLARTGDWYTSPLHSGGRRLPVARRPMQRALRGRPRATRREVYLTLFESDQLGLRLVRLRPGHERIGT